MSVERGQPHAPVDSEAPIATMDQLPGATLAASLRLSWSGSDGVEGTGVASFDVRYRSAPPTSGFGEYVHPTHLERTVVRSATIAVIPGREYCASVRARDGAGNVGTWSVERCSAVGLDDRTLTRSGNWNLGTGSAYMYETWSRTTAKGSSLTLAGVSTRQIGVVARTCPTCGSVDVYVDSTFAGRASLYAPTTRTKQVLWLPSLAATEVGTARLVSASGRQVIVDGILIRH
jgi:hypothetical protein